MHTNLRYDEVDRALGTLPPIRRHVPLLTNARLANLLKSSKRRLQRQRCARGLGLSALPTPRPLPVGDGGGHGTASLLSPRQRAHVTRRARFAAVVDGRTTAAPPPHRPNEFHRDGGKGVYHGAPLALASKVAFLSLGQPASKWLSVGPDGDLNAHAPGNENPRAGSVFTLLDVEDDGKTCVEVLLLLLLLLRLLLLLLLLLLPTSPFVLVLGTRSRPTTASCSRSPTASSATRVS